MLVYSLLLLIVAISLNYFNGPELQTKAFWKRIALVLLILSLPLLWESWTVHSIQSSDYIYLYNKGLLLTNKLILISFLILVLGIVLITSSSKFTLDYTPDQEEERERLIFIFGAILGGIILNSATDFLTILLGLELQSYSVYILAASYRNYEPSEAGGLKYFLLGALSSTLVFMGLALLYTYSGSTSLNTSTLFYQIVDKLNFLPYVGLILMFTGISWKIAASPLHAWSIDVYDAVPTRTTAILSLLPKIGLFSLIGKIIYLLAENFDYVTLDYSGFSHKLIFSIITLCLIVGSIAGLFQPRIKRLLAYSSVLNVGFILLGYLLTNSKLDYYNPTLYIVQYILTTAAIWICLINIPNANGTLEVTLISQLQGIHSNYLKNNLTIIAVCLTALILSVAGIPPMVGFNAKYSAILLAIETGYISLAIIAVITSIISTIYYLNVVKTIWSKSNYSSISSVIFNQSGKMSVENSLVLVFITIIVVLFNLQFQTVNVFLNLSI